MRSEVKYRVQAFVLSYVANFFASMHNPSYVGKNFTWQKFPDLATRMACSNLHISIHLSESDKVTAEDFARKMAIEFSTQLIKEQGTIL
jgi:hypothetical protein